VCSLVILGILASSAPAWAQQPQTRMRNGKLAFAGLITVVVGGALMTPVGDTYDVLGDQYCVTTYAVDAGKCSVGSAQRQVGLIVMATGGVMLGVGLSRVKVYPTRKGAGVAYSVNW
jgi:hypothetical protein